MDLTKYIRDIPDFPKPGILFKDITPLLADPDAFQDAIDRMTEHYRELPVDAVAAVEARGFLFAAPLALMLHKPLVPLRKPGKLPFHTHSFTLRPGVRQRRAARPHRRRGERRPRAAGGRPAGDRRHDEGRLPAGREGRRQGGRLRLPGRVERSSAAGRNCKPHEVFSLIRY